MAKSAKLRSTTGRMPCIAEPTPAATIAASEIGVSRTRALPEALAEPLHLREVAAAHVEVGAEHEDRLVALHLVAHGALEGRGVGHRLAHPGLPGLGRQGGHVGRRRSRGRGTARTRRTRPPRRRARGAPVDAARCRPRRSIAGRRERRGEAVDRVAQAPVGDLVVGAVGDDLARVVALVAVRARLDEARPAARARALGGLVHRAVDGGDVLAVDAHGVEPEALGAPHGRAAAEHEVEARLDGVHVVLAHDDQRQRPRSRRGSPPPRCARR